MCASLPKTALASTCPNPKKSPSASWLGLNEGPEKLAERAAKSKRIARPNAVWEIADAVWDWAQRPQIARSRAS